MPLMAAAPSPRERAGVREPGSQGAPSGPAATPSSPYPDPLPEGEGRDKAGPQTAVAMTWRDMALQPVYAVPNFFDGTPDHRMALRGTKIRGDDPRPQGDHRGRDLWAAKTLGLPPLPQPPWSPEAQEKLALSALKWPAPQRRRLGPLRRAELEAPALRRPGLDALALHGRGPRSSTASSPAAPTSPTTPSTSSPAGPSNGSTCAADRPKA